MMRGPGKIPGFRGIVTSLSPCTLCVNRTCPSGTSIDKALPISIHPVSYQSDILGGTNPLNLCATSRRVWPVKMQGSGVYSLLARVE